MINRWASWCWGALALIPPAVASYFILTHAIAAPLTDEWLLVYNAMIFHAAPGGIRGMVSALGDMRWLMYSHPVVIPNAIYIGLGPLVKFDARVFVFLTLACNAVILLCAYTRGLRGIALAAASLLVFSPARYMEMMWGNQITIGLSVSLGVVGLTLIDAASGHRHKGRFLAGGLVAFLCGLLSSAPAAFAMLTAIPLIAKRDEHQKSRRSLAVLLALAIVASFYILERDALFPQALRLILLIFTAIGALFVSLPVALTTFGFDVRSGIGLAIMMLNGVLIANAYRAGSPGRLSYGLSLIAFGLLTLTSIALSRKYLANWHLECAVPFIVGSLWLAGQSLPRTIVYRRCAQAGIAIIAGVSVIGYWNAFSQYGPSYRQYAENIRSHMRGLLDNPLLEKPYPPTAGWDASPDLVKFLIEADNPDFADFHR